MNLEIICEQVSDVAKEAGEYLLQEINKIRFNDIKEKGTYDFVTYVDTSSEKFLINKLSGILPEAGFIAEENTVSEKDELYKWIIDPLDGTTNFVHTVPLYSISIALMKANEVILGVIYEPNLDECFYAWKGSKAFLNQKEISVSENQRISNSLIATGFPYYDYDKIEQYIKLFIWFVENSPGIRRLGSAAVDLAYVACGRFDGFYEYGLSPWDVAAGALIVQQAGGKIYDFDGDSNYVFGKEIIAANNRIISELLEVVRKYMK